MGKSKNAPSQKIIAQNRGKVKQSACFGNLMQTVAGINPYLGVSYQADQIYITVFCQMQVLHHSLSRQPV